MKDTKPIPVLAIVGPTASGKTALSVALAKTLNGEVISADSMQIYKGVEIACATPREDEREGIPHHMMGFLDPETPYSVADYVHDAKETIEAVHARGHLPILVGGTGLYVDHLLSGTQFIETATDEHLRAELSRKYDEIGGEAMLKELSTFDPETAERLHPNNQKRIIRAFEIYHLTGETMTEALKKSKTLPSPFAPVYIGIAFRDRQNLYDRINLRVDKMLEEGLLEEAEAFFKTKSKTAAQAIGYKEMKPYLDGDCTLEEASEHLKQATRRYAKRQITWFKRNEEIHWLYFDSMTPDAFLESALQVAKASLGM